MLASEIVEALNAEPVKIHNPELMNKDYSAAFASDLMSDVLAMVQQEPEATVLITGLCNAQTLRTAEMLDIDLVIFVRGKKPLDDALDVAKWSSPNIFCTCHTMYEACGILFEKGLGGISDLHTA